MLLRRVGARGISAAGGGGIARADCNRAAEVISGARWRRSARLGGKDGMDGNTGEHGVVANNSPLLAACCGGTTAGASTSTVAGGAGAGARVGAGGARVVGRAQAREEPDGS